jgi:hypothetical protein
MRRREIAMIAYRRIKKEDMCRNPSLGLTTKAKACKSAKQEGSLGGTCYILGSAGECERINLHTPK